MGMLWSRRGAGTAMLGMIGPSLLRVVWPWTFGSRGGNAGERWSDLWDEERSVVRGGTFAFSTERDLRSSVRVPFLRLNAPPMASMRSRGTEYW